MGMHAAYFETVFRASPTPAQWPDQFAVITAFSTTGEVWSDAENLAADSRLEREIIRRNIWMHRLTGSSPDGAHSEPGWAVALPLVEAQALGTTFKQDAVYWIDRDELFVLSCKAGSTPMLIGSFASRLYRDH